jgi:hypothetical protein
MILRESSLDQALWHNNLGAPSFPMQLRKGWETKSPFRDGFDLTYQHQPLR